MHEAVKLLRELVSISSPTGNTGEAVDFLLQWCSMNGIPARVDRGSLVVNPDAKRVLLLGHIDTVFGEVPVRIENGELWGRGSVDAKGPLCASLHALKELGDAGRDVMLIAVPDEEGSSRTAYRLREEKDPVPTVVLEPSVADGITIGYNGRVLMDIKIKADKVHSGHDSPFSAEKAFGIWDSMRSSCRARILRMDSSIEETSMTIDVRFGPDEVPDLPEAGEDLEIEIKERVKPYLADKGSPLVRSFLRGIRSTGGKPVFKRKTGTCDMNVLGEKWDVPMIAYGPGNGRLDHTDAERVDIDEYLTSVEVIKNSLKDILNSLGNQ